MDLLTKIIIISISVIFPGTIYLLFLNRSLINQIKDTPVYFIKDLPSRGKVAFTGHAKTNTLRSPITKNNCVYFKCHVQEFKYLGDDHDPHRITIYQDSSKEPLMISDETGSIRVNLTKANIILGSDLQEIVTADTHSEISANLSQLGINITSSRGGVNSYLVHEEFISAGEQIYIIGYVRQSDGVRMIVNKWNHRLIVSDYNQAGILDIYAKQYNLIKKFAPITLIVIILFLLIAILFCNWLPPLSN